MSIPLEELLAQVKPFEPPAIPGDDVAHQTNVTVFAVTATPQEFAQLNTRRRYLALVNISKQFVYALPSASVTTTTGIPLGGFGGGIALAKVGPANPSLASWWVVAASPVNVVVVEVIRVG